MTDEQTNGYKSGSNLEKILRAGHFAVTGELGPPQSADGEEILHKAELLKDVTDAANITDNQTAIVRMSSIGSGVLAIRAGIEPIVQMTCRDRNRLAIQADLLGAYALGMRNLLCLTGDHQSFGNHPTAKNVHDLDSVQLIQMVKDMRDGACFQCGDQVPGVVEPFEEARSREWLAQDACVPNQADPVSGISGKIYSVDQLSVGSLSL